MGTGNSVGDLITRIRNGIIKNKEVISCQKSFLNEEILKTLEREGFIMGYRLNSINQKRFHIDIHLKYINNEPVIRELVLISKARKEIFVKYETLLEFQKRYSFKILVLSTSKGIISSQEAISTYFVGGKILFKIN